MTEHELDMASPEIITLIASPALPKGTRNDSVLKVMNAAGRSGLTNHEILILGSELSVRWDISSPGKNLYDHWKRLLGALRNVRSHYPNQEK
jgi:hypothetical protein